MTTVVGANVIERDGRVLLVQEGKAGVEGEWNLPSGRLEPGETPVACARREAREEVGLDVTPTALVGVYLDRSPVVEGDVLVCAFRSNAEPGTPAASPGDSVVDVAWAAPQELASLDVRGAYVRRAVADYRAGRAADVDIVADLTT